MKNSSLYLLTILYWIFLPCSVLAQLDEQVLDQYIQNAVKESKAPGLAVAVVKDGEIVFEKGYGYRDMETKTAVTPHSVFAIASCSKAFTAAAIGILVDEGKVNWNDRVVDHLPEFQLHDAYATREMRVLDLLCHRAGFNTFDGDLLWYGTDYTRDEVLSRIRHMPLKNSFRSQYGYSNVMYLAAGELIEAVSGKTWDAFIREHFFQPLEMQASSTSRNEITDQTEWARPHLKTKVIEMISYDNIGPAASINSSVHDLSQWIKMWLNNGTFREATILSPKAVDQLWSGQVAFPVSSFWKKKGIHFKEYALGWYTEDFRGKKLIHHSGGLPGYISKVALVPEENLGLVVLTNNMNSLPTALMYKIIDHVLGVDGPDWAGDFSKFGKLREERKAQKQKERLRNRAENTSSSLELKEYTGIYEDKMYGKAKVELDGDQLVFQMLPTKALFTSKMKHWHHDTFEIKFRDEFLPEGYVTFDFDAYGQITGFTIDLPNPDFHFYNLKFEKLNGELPASE